MNAMTERKRHWKIYDHSIISEGDAEMDLKVIRRLDLESSLPNYFNSLYLRM